MNQIDYSKCCLKEDGVICGNHSKSRLSGLFSCCNLIETLDYGFAERIIIESRIYKQLSDDVICAYHRQKNGKYWYIPNRCLHPSHAMPLTKKKRDRKQDLSPSYSNTV